MRKFVTIPAIAAVFAVSLTCGAFSASPVSDSKALFWQYANQYNGSKPRANLDADSKDKSATLAQAQLSMSGIPSTTTADLAEELVAFAHAVAANDHSRALALAGEIADPKAGIADAFAGTYAETLLEVAAGLATIGETHRAEAIAGQAIALIQSKSGINSSDAVKARLKAAENFADAGEADLAYRFLQQAESGANAAYPGQKEAEERFLAQSEALYRKLSHLTDANRVASHIEILEKGVTTAEPRTIIDMRGGAVLAVPSGVAVGGPILAPPGAGAQVGPLAQKAPTLLRNQQRTAQTRPQNHLIEVFYATNREVISAKGMPVEFGERRGPLKLGIVTVSIPATHQPGEIEAPHWYKLEFSTDPNKDIVVTSIDLLGQKTFFQKLKARVSGAKHKDAFVYIHGFNNSFEDAAERAAQLANDLQFDGAPILYSWPSRGSIMAYQADENELTRPALDELRDFLENVIAQSGAEHITLIAHSMGNRFLLGALEEIVTERKIAGKKPTKLFDQVLFAAPDVDADDFRTRVSDLKGWIGQMTLYASSNDWALQISEHINDYPRAGDVSPMVLVKGLVTIDASAMQSNWFGHSYFANGALADLRATIWYQLPPVKICLLDPRIQQSIPFWVFKGDRCNIDSFILAITLMRQLGIDAARAQLKSDFARATQATATFYAAALKQLNIIGSR